jgi:hypothetical protein
MILNFSDLSKVGVSFQNFSLGGLTFVSVISPGYPQAHHTFFDCVQLSSFAELQAQ